MPASQINSDSKMEALEIEDELIEAIEEAGDDGLTYKDGCTKLGLNYDRFYLLVSQLVLLQRVKLERSRRGNQNRIFLLHQKAPAHSAISGQQREVLDFLISQMDDEGLACPSYGKIAQHTSSRHPVFALERLDYKGFLRVVDRGGPHANIYRVYPKGNGPRGYSPMKPRP